MARKTSKEPVDKLSLFADEDGRNIEHEQSM